MLLREGTKIIGLHQGHLGGGLKVFTEKKNDWASTFPEEKSDGAETFSWINVYNPNKIYSENTPAGSLVSNMN